MIPTHNPPREGTVIVHQVKARHVEQDTPQVLGPLVHQTPPAALLATILCNAAEDLWDAACHEDTPQMWEDARRIASRVLAACPAGQARVE